MGLFSKIFKGIKKVVKKIGKGIKRLVKKVGGAFGKMGILGHIGMMFLMPYASSFWGNLGKLGTRLAQGTNIAGKAFGHVMRGVYHAGKAVGTVYRTVTSAVEGSLKWLSNKAGLTDFANPFSGLENVVKDAQKWGSEGWTGKDSIYDIGDPANYDTDIATGKSSTTPSAGERLVVDDPLQKITDEINKYETPNINTGIESDLASNDSLMSKPGDQSFYDKATGKLKDYTTELWDQTKEKFSPAGISDSITEGMTAGLKQKGAELIVGKAPTPSYKNVKVDFGDIGLTNTPVLDDLALSKFDTQGYSYGSHKMDTHYRDLVGMGYDEYLAYMEKSMPSTTTNYKASQIGF